MRGTVRGLFVTPEKKAKSISLGEVHADPGGFSGDFHAKIANQRQILMLSSDVLTDFDLTPGSLYENMLVEGIDVMSLAPNQQLRVGDAILQVTTPCEPCVQMDRIRSGLKAALNGKRGMFARVVSPGTIRVGDAVEG